jgi:ATP-dependent Clp protease ATP-binding subunit ClpX
MMDVMFEMPSGKEKKVNITREFAIEKLEKSNIQRLKVAS